MTHASRAALAAAFLSLGFTCAALAQGTTTKSPPSGSTATTNTTKVTSVGSGERKFVEEAAMDGMAEVELGKTASTKASNPQVKQFAQRMVADHTRAGDELKALAGQKGIQVPASVDKKHQKDAEHVSKAKDFDHEYMQMMVKDHKKAVSDFEKQSKSAKDPDIKAFAAKTLPTLQEHLQMAQTTYAGLSGGTGTGPGSSVKNAPLGAAPKGDTSKGK